MDKYHIRNGQYTITTTDKRDQYVLWLTKDHRLGHWASADLAKAAKEAHERDVARLDRNERTE